MQQGKSEMQAARNEMANGRSELVSAHKDLQAAYEDLNETISEMEEVRDAIPGMFDEAEANYLSAIDAEADTIQATYQQTLNAGFKDMAVFVAICAIISEPCCSFPIARKPLRAPGKAIGWNKAPRRRSWIG